jgi:D-glucosaminate-6-phosphate ammonia-lyase
VGIYEELGLRRVINANATRTDLGGSLMPQPVLDAMNEAAGAFVDMYALQSAVSGRLAEVTHNEAALVCTGCAAGLFLATLGCMTGNDLGALARLMDEGVASLRRNEIVVHAAHRNPYDPAIKLAGARMIEVGNVWQTFDWELAAALNERTAGVFYFYGNRQRSQGALPLETVIDIAHAQNVPVVVDGAAQLPPAENLWRFTEMGADLALFSGGKGLRGPQASGLMVGRRELVNACALHAAPNQRLGRPMKVGKEEMVGLLAAVEYYLALDQSDVQAKAEAIVARWVEKLGEVPGVNARRDFPSEAGQSLPRAYVSFRPPVELTGENVRDALLAGTPAVSVAVADDGGLFLNPETLQPGEDRIVCDRIIEVIRSATHEHTTVAAGA